MTTEEDFRQQFNSGNLARLDFDTIRVMGDWLEDHNDPRGPGYRALGLLTLFASATWFDGVAYWTRPPSDRSNLPGDWYVLLTGGRPSPQDRRSNGVVFTATEVAALGRAFVPAWRDYGSGGMDPWFGAWWEVAEDAVNAFARLPRDRQDYYLTPGSRW